jgi:hypothetical protein
LRLSKGLVAHYLPTDTRQTDPDLSAIVAAWPTLPEPIKAGIVAMVKASGHTVAEDGAPRRLAVQDLVGSPVQDPETGG